MTTAGAAPAPGDDAADAADAAQPDRPVVAAFDFDGTLTSGGSVWRFLAAMRGPGVVARAGLRLTGKIVRAAVVGGGAIDDAKEALFTRTLAGLARAEAERRAADFGLTHYRRHARQDTRARLEAHRNLGHRVVLVSASPELYLRPVGAELEVDGVVATRLAVDREDRLTGAYQGQNCRGEEKWVRLQEWIKAEMAGEPAPLVWAYGNSAGDRDLLAAADVGVDVGKLGPVGKLRRFRRLRDTIELRA